MREEDEIRIAVAALSDARDAGEDISEELPDADLLIEAMNSLAASEGEEGDDGSCEILQSVMINVFEHVRAESRASRLSSPKEWELAGLVPPSMGLEDLEMAVYDRLMEVGASEVDTCPAGHDGAAGNADYNPATANWPLNKHVTSPYSSSNGRPVGAMNFGFYKAHSKATTMGDLPGNASFDQEANTNQEELPDDVNCKEGGEFCADDCDGIRLLMGAESYYLYDSSSMTDAFARWAFLAVENDSVAILTECVREESSTYPRPMALSTLTNPPFLMSPDEIEAAYERACSEGRANDIERVAASNGDVYFFSKKYMNPRLAHALAEQSSVKNVRNV